MNITKIFLAGDYNQKNAITANLFTVYAYFIFYLNILYTRFDGLQIMLSYYHNTIILFIFVIICYTHNNIEIINYIYIYLL